MNNLNQSNSPIADPVAFSGLAIPTDNIVGTKVVNRQNEDLGRVEEVVIDVINGRIAFLVLSFGGFLGVGEKTVRCAVEGVALRKRTASLCA